MGTAKEMMKGTSFAVITLLSCLGGVLGSGIKVSVDHPLVIVSRGDDVTITCTYNTDTYIAWVANGSIPVSTLGIMTTGGHVRGRPGLYFNALLIQNAGSNLNNTVFTCPLGRVTASSHLYVLNPLGPVQEIAAVYPLNKEDPIVICWTPPPAYTLAPIIRYHLKLTASTNEASTRDVTEVDLTAERGTCAAIDEYFVRGIIYGRVYALSIAAENTLGMSVHTSTSVAVSLFKGSRGNADGGSDTGGFVVATESVTNDEGYISILVNWKLLYQWTPFKYQFHCSCSHTPNVTMETAVMNITLHGPFTLGEECVVRVRACLRDDGCTWTISSKDLLFTAGTYLQNVTFQQTAGGVVVSCEFAVSDQALLCRVTFSIGTEVTRTVTANVMDGSSPPVASVVVSDLPPEVLEYSAEAVNVSDGMAIEDFRMTGMISLLPNGGDSVQPQANNEMLAITSLAGSLGALLILFVAVTTVIVVYYNCKAKRAKLRADANLAAAIRNELLNPYQLEPTDSGDHLRVSASCTGSAVVQWHRNKTTAADDDDAYMVMAGRRRSVCSPGPSEMAATIAKDNKAFAIYAEIGESAKVDLH